MVKRPQQRYDVLFRELRNQAAEQPKSNSSNDDDMKNELKRYLMDLNSSSASQSQYPQSQYPQSQYPQPQSDFIELGSTYK